MITPAAADSPLLAFAEIWPVLLSIGWKCIRGGANTLDTWHYLQPNAIQMVPSERTRGVDYFGSEEAVLEHVVAASSELNGICRISSCGTKALRENQGFCAGHRKLTAAALMRTLRKVSNGPQCTVKPARQLRLEGDDSKVALSTYRELITAALRHHGGQASKEQIATFVQQHRVVKSIGSRLNEYTPSCWTRLSDGYYKLNATAPLQVEPQQMSTQSSKYRGVWWSKSSRKWQITITYDGSLHYLGCFEDEEEAARAHDTAAKAHCGDMRPLNFPTGGEEKTLIECTRTDFCDKQSANGQHRGVCNKNKKTAGEKVEGEEEVEEEEEEEEKQEEEAKQEEEERQEGQEEEHHHYQLHQHHQQEEEHQEEQHQHQQEQQEEEDKTSVSQNTKLNAKGSKALSKPAKLSRGGGRGWNLKAKNRSSSGANKVGRGTGEEESAPKIGGGRCLEECKRQNKQSRAKSDESSYQNLVQVANIGAGRCLQSPPSLSALASAASAAGLVSAAGPHIETTDHLVPSTG
jgi:hypothetical protein